MSCTVLRNASRYGYAEVLTCDAERKMEVSDRCQAVFQTVSQWAVGKTQG